MLNQDNLEILTQSQWAQLAQDKITDRQEFLKIPPQEAQSILNEVIDPKLWKPVFNFESEFNSLSLTNDDFNG
jgi:hypothetical protein